MRREVLKAEGLVFGYQDDPVINGVSISLREGEVVAIYGPTGSGKTTLMLLLGGLLRPWEGEIYVLGQRLDERNRSLRRYIGIAFQNPDDMFFNATVLDEIAYTSARIYGVEEGLRSAKIIAEKLGIAHLLDKPPYKLSGGQKKLISIAVAAAHNPKILLLDEPTTYLDQEAEEKVVRFVEELRKYGVAILVATHDMEFICKAAQRSYMLINGKLIPSPPTLKKPLCLCSRNVLGEFF